MKGIAPSIVFTLMLLCRLIVEFQVKRRESKAQTVSTPEQQKKEN